MKQLPATKIKTINNPRYLYNLWNDVNVDKIWCYFDVQLLIVGQLLWENHDKPLCKLEAFIKILCTQFRTVYIPEQHLAIDEYLALWKGRLNQITYSKQTRAL